MKSKYGWCVPLDTASVEEIWKTGILTLDTNVLLDLYRYHEDTRTALMNTLGHFEGRAWISHQTAWSAPRTLDQCYVRFSSI